MSTRSHESTRSRRSYSIIEDDKQNNGYKKTGKNQTEFKTVLFVLVNKDGILAKEMKKREEEINKFSKERIKIVEDGGIKLKNMLVNKNPFKVEKCEQKKCVLCQENAPMQLK